ncbi:MAG: RNA polymerase sigma factor [Gemmatimonadota bacterium]
MKQKRESSTALAGREPTPLETWVAIHSEELRRHLTGMLDDGAAAEDVLQEVWSSAHRRPPDLGPDSNVRAWLYRVATHAALDRLASERRRTCALRAGGHTLVPDGPTPPDAAVAGLDSGGRNRIRAAVASLPRKQREAVWRRWAREEGYIRIGEALDCSPDSARANVYNALKRLRKELFDLWEEENRA